MWTKFNIVSARTIDSKQEKKKYVLYNIKIYKGFEKDNQIIFIERRYTDFLHLYLKLRQEHPGPTANISFPRKVLLGNFSSELIKTRLLSLETFLKIISENTLLLCSIGFKRFLIGQEEKIAKQLLEAKDYFQAKPLLENTFKILNYIHTEKNPAVIIALCRLTACCSADPEFLNDAMKYAELALHRFQGISDVDLLYYYIPLLQMCSHLWTASGRDAKILELQLNSLKRLGHKVDGCPSLLESLLTVE